MRRSHRALPVCTRRALLGGLAALVAACGRRTPSERSAATSVVPEPRVETAPVVTTGAAMVRPAPPAPPGIAVRTLAFGPSQGGPRQAVLVTPSGGPAGARYPLLVALGGLGETRRGLAAGAAGWVKDYWLDRTLKRLAAPPLTRDDFQGFVIRRASPPSTPRSPRGPTAAWSSRARSPPTSGRSAASTTPGPSRASWASASCRGCAPRRPWSARPRRPASTASASAAGSRSWWPSRRRGPSARSG